jgi:hypothetical protein
LFDFLLVEEFRVLLSLLIDKLFHAYLVQAGQVYEKRLVDSAISLLLQIEPVPKLGKRELH